MILRPYSTLNIIKSSNNFARVLISWNSALATGFFCAPAAGSGSYKSYYLIVSALSVDLVNFHSDSCSSTPSDIIISKVCLPNRSFSNSWLRTGFGWSLVTGSFQIWLIGRWCLIGLFLCSYSLLLITQCVGYARWMPNDWSNDWSWNTIFRSKISWSWEAGSCGSSFCHLAPFLLEWVWGGHVRF